MINLTDSFDVNRPFASIRALAEHGVRGLYHEKVPGLGLAARLDALSLGAGIGTIIQVNNCESAVAHFTESDDSTFDVGTTATNKVGTNAVTLTGTKATDASQWIETKYIDRSALPGQRTLGSSRQMDWRDTRYLGFWKSGGSAEYGTASELKVAIVNNGVVQTAQNTAALVGTEHRYVTIDMEAAEWDRDRVEAVRFYSNQAGTGEVAIIDMIQRFEYQFDRGPYYGCMYHITSGTTLSQGDTVTWTLDGLIKTTSSADADDLGPVILIKNGAPVTTAIGNAQHDVWGIIPGMRMFIGRDNDGTAAAGDYLEWAANGYYVDVTGAATEKGFAKAMESAGAQHDDIFMVVAHAGACD